MSPGSEERAGQQHNLPVTGSFFLGWGSTAGGHEAETWTWLRSRLEARDTSYAEGVTARSPGLAMRSEASYPGSRSFQKMRYSEGVIAGRKRVGNNAFSVEEAGDLNPG